MIYFIFALLLATTPLLAAGNIDYHLNEVENPTDDERDAYARIKIAMDSAVYIYNKYTNLTKHIEVHYRPGVPTAEASSNGTLSFGSDRTYMFVGTAMHEMAHTLGMGTTNEYKNAIVNGVFQGEKAQAKLKELTGDNSAELHGDGTHFWPYGLNYASEVKSEEDLIIHAQVVEAMHQDLFKEIFFYAGKIKSVSENNCIAMADNNALTLMDCSDTHTELQIFSVGDPAAYRIQFKNRVIDVPNESTAPGLTLGTYGWNGGAHQKMYIEKDIADTSIFYLKNVKSNLYVTAHSDYLTQDERLGDTQKYQWTFQIFEAEKEPTDFIKRKIVIPEYLQNKNHYDLKGRKSSARKNYFIVEVPQ